MPDYNPAVASSIQPPQSPNWAGTLGTVANIQAEQARTNLYTLQALQQQRQYTGLMAAAQALREGRDPVAAAGAYGVDPTTLNAYQALQQSQTFARTHGNLSPQGAEATANIALRGAETGLARAKIPGAAAESDVSINAGAAQVASQYANDPSPQSRAAMIDYTRKYKGDLAANDLAKLSDDELMARAKGHIGATPQGNELVTTQTPQGAPVYQTKAQFIAGGPQIGQTPGGKEEQEKRGAALGESLPKLQEDSNNSIQANFTLDQMRDESKGFTMGAYAPTATTFAKYLKPIANSLGSNRFDEWVGSNEDFAKNAGVLARQAVKEISNRPSQLEFTTVSNQLPHDAMSQQGFNGIVDQFTAVNHFKQAKAFAAQAWQNKNGTMNGFEADWNSHIGPAAFLVANMSPEQQTALKTKLSPSVLKSIVGQLKWAHDNGLENGLH